MAPRGNMRRIYGAYLIVLVLVLALGLLFGTNDVDWTGENVPVVKLWGVMEAVFGFFGCILIVLVSKALGRLFVQKKEGYYDDE